MTWSDEAIAELKRLHAGSLFSCSEMALRLTEQFRQACSRNSVIGKLLRLGLTNKRATGPKPKVRKVRPARHDPFRPTIAAAPEPTSAFSALVDDVIPLGQRRTLQQLQNYHCHWPIGDPASPDFFFCAEPSADVLGGRPYCLAHQRRATAGPGRAPAHYAWGRGRK